MVDTAAVQAGQRILVHAGSGAVGSLAIRLLKDLGATGIAIASGRNRALVESLGGQVREDSPQVLRPGGIQVSLISLPDADHAAGCARSSGLNSPCAIMPPPMP